MPTSSFSRPRSVLGSERSVIGQVTQYDRVAGLLLALLLLIGLAVAVLVFVWIGSKFVVRNKTVPVVLALPKEEPGGSPTGTSSEGMTLDTPTTEQIRSETNVALPDFSQTLAAVEDLIASRRADLVTAPSVLDQPTGGGGRSTGTGNAPAFGSGDGTAGLSRGQRWEIRYASGDTLEDYCRELDFFGIELAAVGLDGRVEYCRNVSQKQPTVDRERKSTETRLYMIWRDRSARRDSDRTILERNGIKTDGKTLVQFIPTELEERLARLEFEFAKLPAAKIRKTRFAVRPKDGGFEFFTADQIPLE